MKIGLASDHRGYKLKQQLIEELVKRNYEVEDYGTDSEESTDYPDYAFKLGENVRDKKVDFGVAICGSGIGISIACNKVNGIRCAKVNTVLDAKMTRLDNDANVIALSAKTNKNDAIELINTFLETKFSNEKRHINRINKIKNYEENR